MNDIIPIDSPDLLIKEIQKTLQETSSSGKYYRLEGDLNFDGINFTPFGNESEAYVFNGTLDGNGYSIKNLSIATSQAYNIGLFVNIGVKGRVANLKFDNFEIIQDISSSGSPAGETITNVGIVASFCSGKIENCSARGSVNLKINSAKCFLGGLCGKLVLTKNKSACISNSWTDVEISITKVNNASDDKYYIGGIAGENTGTITYCHSRSEIIPVKGNNTSFAIGGICGIARPSSAAKACYNIGILHNSGAKDDLTGGIVGEVVSNANDPPIFKNCFYLDLSVKNGNLVGTPVSWNEIIREDFVNKLNLLKEEEIFAKTEPFGCYTYAPHIKSQNPENSLDEFSEFYAQALCTPLAIYFKRSYHKGETLPLWVEFALANCLLDDATVTARKQGGEPVIMEHKLGSKYLLTDIGNNIYDEYFFTVTLFDEKYKRYVTLNDTEIIDKTGIKSSSEEVSMINEEITSPVIQKPGVTVGRRNAGRHPFYWFGYIPPPPPPGPYFAEFSAEIKNAVYFSVLDKDKAVIVDADINKTDKFTINTMSIQNKTTPYSYDALIFAVRDEAGQPADIAWPENPSMSSDIWTKPLIRIVWSMTNKCNLMCRHCGTREAHKGLAEPDRRDFEHIKSEIIKAGVTEVVLTGGEPTLSPYFCEAIEGFSKAFIPVSIMTNGTNIDEKMAALFKKYNVRQVAVSIDNTPEQPSGLRDASSLKKTIKGIKAMKDYGIFVSAVTTVHSENIGLLDDIRSMILETGADQWGIRPVLPFGKDECGRINLLSASQLNILRKYCHEKNNVNGLPIIPYSSLMLHFRHSLKESGKITPLGNGDAMSDFSGSPEGIYSAQILSDGSVVGACADTVANSAGNVHERSLIDIWQDKNSFKDLREFDVLRLEGICAKCTLKDSCKGGDLTTRLAYGGIYGQNMHCVKV